jgi:hypothetical protein
MLSRTGTKLGTQSMGNSTEVDWRRLESGVRMLMAFVTFVWGNE